MCLLHFCLYCQTRQDYINVAKKDVEWLKWTSIKQLLNKYSYYLDVKKDALFMSWWCVSWIGMRVGFICIIKNPFSQYSTPILVIWAVVLLSFARPTIMNWYFLFYFCHDENLNYPGGLEKGILTSITYNFLLLNFALR